jgi:hypothetical protein
MGSICFEETVNTQVHVNVFNTFVNQLDDEELQHGFFQQDGVTCHTSNDSIAEIEETIVSKGLWPPRSPDLTPPDFFLWSILKGHVYGNRPRTLQDLQNKIKSEIQVLTPEILYCTFQNVERMCKHVWKPKVDTFSTCYDGYVFNMKQGMCLINFMLLNVLVGKLYRHFWVQKVVGHSVYIC